jgi:hypothetical protein
VNDKFKDLGNSKGYFCFREFKSSGFKTSYWKTNGKSNLSPRVTTATMEKMPMQYHQAAAAARDSSSVLTGVEYRQGTRHADVDTVEGRDGIYSNGVADCLK